MNGPAAWAACCDASLLLELALSHLAQGVQVVVGRGLELGAVRGFLLLTCLELSSASVADLTDQTGHDLVLLELIARDILADQADQRGSVFAIDRFAHLLEPGQVRCSGPVVGSGLDGVFGAERGSSRRRRRIRWRLRVDGVSDPPRAEGAVSGGGWAALSSSSTRSG